MEYVIINGPNLNLLGKREPGIYGNRSFEDYLSELALNYPDDIFHHEQYNVEGDIVTAIQTHGYNASTKGIVLNAAAYTHTSIAIADAIAAIPKPVIAVHISNIFARESERHTDLLVSKCKGMICGLGLKGYELALMALMMEE